MCDVPFCFILYYCNPQSNTFPSLLAIKLSELLFTRYEIRLDLPVGKILCLKYLMCLKNHKQFFGLPWWLSSKEYACQCRRHRQVQCVNWEDPLEKEMTTHSSILGWRIPWTEGYRPWGHKRVRHDLVTKQQQQKIVLYIWLHRYILWENPNELFHHLIWVGIEDKNDGRQLVSGVSLIIS